MTTINGLHVTLIADILSGVVRQELQQSDRCCVVLRAAGGCDIAAQQANFPRFLAWVLQLGIAKCRIHRPRIDWARDAPYRVQVCKREECTFGLAIEF